MRLSPVLSMAMAAMALTACERNADTARPVPMAEGEDDAAVIDPTPSAGTSGETGAPPDSGAAAVRLFDCEGGHRVEVVGGDSARVTLADGRVIELPSRTDGVAEYRGEALTFDIDPDGRGGVLGQDEVGGFACEPGD